MKCLHELLEQTRVEEDLPALAAAVGTSDGIITSAATGVRRYGSDDAVAAHDLFHIGSCTKAMTATTLAVLVEGVYLSWDTALGDVFPSLNESMAPAYRKVTLHQLLTFQAGVPPLTERNQFQSKWTMMDSVDGTSRDKRRAFIDRLLREPPLAEPGTQVIYSNASYAVATAMAEEVAGQTCEDLMSQCLFGPIGMTSAVWGWPATPVRPNQPFQHRLNERTGAHDPLELDDPHCIPACMAPAGDLSCTIQDMALFAVEHLRGVSSGTALLHRESFARIHADIEGSSMGWGEGELPEYGRISAAAGSATTFWAEMWLLHEKNLAIVVAANTGTAQRATQKVVSQIAQEYGSSEGA